MNLKTIRRICFFLAVITAFSLFATSCEFLSDTLNDITEATTEQTVGSTETATAEATTQTTSETVTTGKADDYQPVEKPQDPNTLKLVYGDSSTYKIVYSATSQIGAKDAAATLQSNIKTKYGYTIPVVSDEGNLPESGNYIFVGSCKLKKSAEATSSVRYTEYGIGNWGSDVYVVGYTKTALESAVALFSTTFKDSIGGTTHLILAPFAATKSAVSNTYLNSVPTYQGVGQVRVFPVSRDNQCYEILYKGVSKTDFETYCTRLNVAGAEKTAENVIGNVTFETHVIRMTAVYVNYRSTDGSMRIVCENKATAFLPDGKPAAVSDGARDTLLFMRGVSKPGTYDNGMNFIYLLPDDTFVIYDIGQSDAATLDSDHLYHTLSKIAATYGINKIVVSAWFVTHAHADHVGAFPTFYKNHVQNNQVTVKTVILNDASSEQGSAGNSGWENNVRNAVTGYSPETRIIRIHAGQVFYLSNVRFEVFYTLEELDPSLWSEGNESSLMMRLTVGGTTMLMTGDSSYHVWDTVRECYGSVLKTTWMQAPHHGTWHGGREIDYDTVQPSYILYPCGEYLFGVNKTSSNANIATITNYVLNTYTTDGKGNSLNNYWVAGTCTSATSGRVTRVNFHTGIVSVLENY